MFRGLESYVTHFHVWLHLSQCVLSHNVDILEADFCVFALVLFMFNVCLNVDLVQLEIDDGKELTEAFLYEEVHPKLHAHKQAFAKPQGPAGKRGHKRLIKGPGETIQDS